MGPPSGEQVVLRHGPWEAVVVEVGGGLRSLTRDGVPLLDGFAEGEMAGGGRGQVLAPWPNRMAGGAYGWEGRTSRPRCPSRRRATRSTAWCAGPTGRPTTGRTTG